jgi:hypothetical protein
MDVAITLNDDDDDDDGHFHRCEICPKHSKCSRRVHECVFAIAHTTLKEIIDMAVIK